MLSDFYSCEICFSPFDGNKHIPRLIPTCGHTVCSFCLTKILQDKRKCPFDNTKFSREYKSIDNFPKNLTLLQLAEQKLNGEFELCNRHGQVKNLVCINDAQQICEQCADNHKGHNVKLASELQKDAQAKKKKLELFLHQFEEQEQGIDILFKDTRKFIETILVQEFNKVRNIIKEKEIEIGNSVGSSLEIKRDEVINILEKDESFKNKYQAKLCDLDNQFTFRFFRTLESLEKDIPPCNAKLELNQVEKNIEATKKEIASVLKSLSDSLVPLVENTSSKIIDILTDFVEPKSSPVSDKSKVVEANSIKIQEFNNRTQVNTQQVSSQKNLSVSNPIQLVEKSIDEALFPPQDLMQISQTEFTKSNSHPQNVRPAESPSINSVSNLKLHLDTKNSRFQNGKIICNSIPDWKPVEVESLYLDYAKSEVKDVSMIQFIQNDMAQMTNVKCISLSLRDTQISSQTLQTFATSVIPNAKSLLQLVLGLYGTEVTDFGIMELSKQMSTFSVNIRQIRLNLSSIFITDESLKAFTNGLTPINNLEMLQLYLSKTQITDVGIDFFWTNTKKVFKNTKKLHVDFGKTELTDKGLSNADIGSTSGMTLLENVKIYLTKSSITDSGAENLFLGLTGPVSSLFPPRFTNEIKILNFDFESTKITDKTVIQLSQLAIPGMKALKVFKLNVNNTPITNQSLIELSQALKPLYKNLEKFRLSLDHTKVTALNIRVFVDTIDLQFMAELRSFDISFDGIIVQHSIKKRLKHIKEQLSLRNKT